jgi:hypothetical protein
MKKKKIVLTPWTNEEVSKLRSYVSENSQELVSNLLVNIVTGYLRFRKNRRFFINMGKFLDRSSKICKSKFQKLERKIYIEFLNLPTDYYELFCHIRKQKPKNVNYDFIKQETIKPNIHSQPNNFKSSFIELVDFISIK